MTTPTPETLGPVQLGRRINALLRDKIIGASTHFVLGQYVIAWRDDRKRLAEAEKCDKCGADLFIRCLVCAGDEEPAALAHDKEKP